MTAIALLLATALGSPAGGIDTDAAVRLAREALGAELGAASGELLVREVSAALWTDSSLGCARKQTRYLPVLTLGYRVALEHAGRVYVMHVGAGRAVRCDRKTVLSPERDRREAAARLTELLGEARRDLARRLDVPEPAIQTASLRRATAPDGSVGFVIELQVAESRYRYHADERQAVFGPELLQR